VSDAAALSDTPGASDASGPPDMPGPADTSGPSDTPVPFGARLADALVRRGRLCVGVDPHPFLLDRWGLADDAAGVREFGLRTVDAVAGRAGIVKPQVAFFERHGSAGYAALEQVLAAARAAGLLVIADAKRGDIGTSVEAYGRAWLTPGSPLESDAVTVAAYTGVGSLDPVVALARDHGKGLFVLAATSNPEAAGLQRAVLDDGAAGRRGGASVAAGIVADVRAAADASDAAVADLGVVIGATVRLADYGLAPHDLGELPVLAPGFGHQGAGLADIDALFGSAAPRVIAAASRSILFAGPDGIADAVARHAEAAR